MRRAGHKGEGAGFMCEGALLSCGRITLCLGEGGSMRKEAGLK